MFSFIFFIQMSRKLLKVLTMEEIFGILEEKTGSDDDDDEYPGDVIIVPPDVDALTDEDIEDDEETGNVMVDDVPGYLELHTETDLHYVAESVDENNLTLRFQEPSTNYMQG